ncbi:unnamed protein product, partial [Brenthis ino]
MSDNIKVVVKVRPLIPREIEDKLSYQWRVNNNTLYQIDQNGRECGPAFTFDQVYDKDTKTSDVYNDIAKPIVEAATAGFNGTIFAYGQTSSGKTYTMTGTDDAPGLIPLAVLNLFDIIKKVPDRDFLVRVSYVEIYNETLIDLLDMKKTVTIKDTVQGLKVDATYKVTTSPEEVLEIMREGKANRQTGSTNMNEESSRSHSIFQITIESRDHIEGEQEVGSVNVSQLNLVDLAGSERSGQTGATGIRFKEGTHINRSLSALALVIKQLSESPLTGHKHVNYRDSKLTRLLQNSLGGNAKTSIICAVTPAAVEETISTLQFANRAKAIKNTPAVNAVATDASMIQSLTKQLSLLKTQLEGKKNVEQDNFNLQKQITQLQKLILNGFAERTSTDLISGARRRLIPPRRMTISTLHPIQEDPVPAMPKFCTPSLKYNPLVIPGVSDFQPIQSASSLASVCEERAVTPPGSKKVNFSDEVIELDSDDDDSSTDVQTCSPYHKCYNSSKTPPCILRKTAKQAEKNLQDIVELTEREKIYTPNIVELMEKLESKSLKIAELEDELIKLGNLSEEKDKEMEKLKSNITNAEKQIKQITIAKEELEKACKDYNTKLTDWEVSYETLKKKSKSREDELLSLLQEHELKKKREVIGKISSKAIEKELNFMDMSRDILLVDSEFDNSITNIDSTQTLLAQSSKGVQSQPTQKNQSILDLEANLKAQKLRIDSLENINKDLQNTIQSYKEKISYIEHENSLHKSSIDNLNNTIENQKSLLETANADIESYNSVIQELQLKLVVKDNSDQNVMNDSDIETMIANEEMFIANHENMKNILQSLKTALKSRDEEIKHLKTKITENVSNIDFIAELDNKKKEIALLKDEINSLITQDNEKTDLIDKLVKEKKDLLNMELQLKIQLSGIQKDKELLEKQNGERALEVDRLKEYSEKLTSELAEKEREITCEKENSRKEIEIANKKIIDLENDIKIKENIITSLNKEDIETQENIAKAKSTLEKLQKIISLFTDDILVVPEIMDNIVTALSTLSDNLTSFESIALEAISEKNNVKQLLDQQQEELNNIQIKIHDLNNAVDSFYAEYQNVSEVNNDNIVKTAEKDTCEKLKCKVMNLITTMKTSQAYFNECIQNKDKELNALRLEHERTISDFQTKCSKASECSQQIDKLVHNRDEMLKNILEKATRLTSEFNIENSISCQLSDGPENMFEEIALTLDKIANHVSIIKSGQDKECNTVEEILAEAKSEIKQLTEENLKLIQDITNLENNNVSLSNELNVIHGETNNMTKDLKESAHLLDQLRQDLMSKSSEIEIIESRAKEWKDKFIHLEYSMKEQINCLETENSELKLKCSELELHEKYVNNLQKQVLKDDQKDFSRKSNAYIEFNSPPSLLTICCNKIVDVIQPLEDEKSMSSHSCSELKDDEYMNTCRCDELMADLTILKADNTKLKHRIVELENDNENHIKEQEEVQMEVRLLLEHTHELQKKIVNHRTNLSTLTATTYAENRSLSSQLKFLQHHHSRFHTVCQRDIPEFKKQLQDLMIILKTESCLNKCNDSFKRYSLPNALETASLHSTFKNESTMDGELLMLDTNLTLTTCDNTLLANDQTCFDATQVCTVNEVATQTDVDDITKYNISHPQITPETSECIKIIETLESLKNENDKLRYLVEDYSKNKVKVSVTDAQSSPIKISNSLNNSLSIATNDYENKDSCGDCEDKNEVRIIEEKYKAEIEVMSKNLTDLKSQRDELEEKYRNLTLEMPNTESLVRKLTSLEEDFCKKQNEIEVLTDSLAKKNNQLKVLQEENDSLSNQVMESISEVDDLKKEHDLLKEINNDLTNKFTQLEEEITRLKCKKDEEQICQECMVKDEMIISLENKMAETHAKLDRSYSDSDSSSRYNKICTLQNELHAGREDCIELKEEVTTIKNHLERSNLSISHAMDLDESITDALVCSFNKSTANSKCEHMPTEQENNMYALDKIDCINYYIDKVGVDKESLKGDTKIIDVMKMLYDSFTVKHANEIENLVNKLKDFEESKSELENKVFKLNSEQTRLNADLMEKDSYLQTMANVVSQIRNNISVINEDTDSENLIFNFSDKILRKVDKEFGFTSTVIFDWICNKYNNLVETISTEKQHLIEEVQRMAASIDSVNENLASLKSQLTEKEKELELVKWHKENIDEISTAVTLDIVNKEKDLKLLVRNGYEKLLENRIITQTIDFDFPTLDILKAIFDIISLQGRKNNQEQQLEMEKNSLILQLEQLKADLQLKDQQQNKAHKENKKLIADLKEKEQQYLSQVSLHEDLNKIHEKKVEENSVNINVINKLKEEITIYKNTVVEKDDVIASLESKINILNEKSSLENDTKVTDLLQSVAKSQQEIDNLKTVNQTILKEKEICASEFSDACAKLNKNKIDMEKLTSDIQILRTCIKENSELVETLKIESRTLSEQNKLLQNELQEKCKECTRLMNNIKTHEKTAQIQSGIINRLRKQKEDDDKICLEKEKLIQELNEKLNSLDTQYKKLDGDLKTCREEIDQLTKAKHLLEVRISELETDVEAKPRLSIDIAESTRRRRQSIHDSKRMFSDSVQDHKKIEAVFKSRGKPDDLFMDVDDDSSARSTPIRQSKGRESLASKHDHSDNTEEHSRPSSVLASRRRRQSVHDLHRSVHSQEHSRESSRNNSIDCEVTQLRKQLESCQQELEELKVKYKEVDEECEICAEYLKERDEQCSKLKEDKVALENIITDLKDKLKNNNPNQANAKATFADAAVNTDEDWTNLHSVVVDRMSYNAEVEKNKKLMKSIEELRFKNHGLKTTMAKMQKALEKNTVKDSKELEATRAELSACKQELEELKVRYKELDEECETCAEYLRERDEQCARLRDAKAGLEAKLQEYQDVSNMTHSVRKKRQTLHDQNRRPSTTLTDASTETSDGKLIEKVIMAISV